MSGLVMPIGSRNPDKKPHEDKTTSRRQSLLYMPVFLKISIPVDQNGSMVASDSRMGFSLSCFAMSVCLALTSATPN
jgi:hypothetical protein